LIQQQIKLSLYGVIQATFACSFKILPDVLSPWKFSHGRFVAGRSVAGSFVTGRLIWSPY
jgi:hypothetical protein